LDRDGRIRELARLQVGDRATDTALRAAAEQLDAADAYKRTVNQTGG
jgi:DNA repair ATPase RecN